MLGSLFSHVEDRRITSLDVWYHHGLLDPKIPYSDPIKGRFRYPKGLIAHSGSPCTTVELGFLGPDAVYRP